MQWGHPCSTTLWWCAGLSIPHSGICVVSWSFTVLIEVIQCFTVLNEVEKECGILQKTQSALRFFYGRKQPLGEGIKWCWIPATLSAFNNCHTWLCKAHWWRERCWVSAELLTCSQITFASVTSTGRVSRGSWFECSNQPSESNDGHYIQRSVCNAINWWCLLAALNQTEQCLLSLVVTVL